MYKFNLSAPGKVYLGGDPTRYEDLCVAASLNQRTMLNFTSILPPGDFIEINFVTIKLHMKIPLKTIVHFAEEYFKSSLTDVHLYDGIRDFVNSLSDCTLTDGTYNSSNPEHHLSLQAFFFLLNLIARIEKINIQSSFSVKISTELAIGEGLGSSASFAACLAACFYRWSFLQKGVVLYEFDLATILHYVQRCEWIIYNSQTMIDSFVSVYGSIHVFQKQIPINVFCDMPSMRILMVFSNVSQKTLFEQKGQMRRMRISYPFIESIRDTIEEIVEKIHNILGDMEKRISDTCINTHSALSMNELDEDLFHLVSKDCCVQLLNLIHMNQGLLRTLGMSHPYIDVICAIARNSSLAGKLTNNGGGGYAFILLLPDSTDEQIESLLNKLESLNFSAQVTDLNCSGVKIEP